jgi:hypothetical protein
MRHQLYYYVTADPAHPEKGNSTAMQRCTICLREFVADSMQSLSECSGKPPKCINHDFRKLHSGIQCRTCYLNATPEFVEGYEMGYLMGRESVNYDDQFGLGRQQVQSSLGDGQ